MFVLTRFPSSRFKTFLLLFVFAKKINRIKNITKKDKIRVHELNKGCGFAIVTNDTAKGKIEEQPGKSTKAKIDPTSRLTNKIQKKIYKLRKQIYKQDLF